MMYLYPAFREFVVTCFRGIKVFGKSPGGIAISMYAYTISDMHLHKLYNPRSTKDVL